jgi:hypothetical protein
VLIEEVAKCDVLLAVIGPEVRLLAVDELRESPINMRRAA